MIDLLNLLDFLSAAAGMIGMVLVVYGWRASFTLHGDRATWWFVVCFTMLAVAVIDRRLAWDLILPLASADAAAWMRAHRPHINFVLGLPVLAAVSAGLKAQHCSLPAEDQAGWHWTMVWRYPRGGRVPR